MTYGEFFSVRITPAGPHSANDCFGNCKQHTLLIGETLKWHRAVVDGGSWGNIVYREEQRALEALSEAERAVVIEQREAAVQRVVEEITVGAESIQMARHAEKMAHTSKKLGGKKPMPCKFLYCPAGTKDVYANAVCSECWAWEYTDPKTKKRKTPRTCPYLHPGEEGWQDVWMTDRRVKVAVALPNAARNINALKAAPKQQPPRGWTRPSAGTSSKSDW